MVGEEKGGVDGSRRGRGFDRERLADSARLRIKAEIAKFQ